jgi:hypothetical protein
MLARPVEAVMRLGALALSAVLVSACGNTDTGPSDDPADYDVDTSVEYEASLSAPRWVVPSPALPSNVILEASNNNCDIAIYDKRLFLGFRTAPTHFASSEAAQYVVSSANDGATWQLEREFRMYTDLREPKFLNFGGKLRYHYFQAGSDPVQFTPIAMWRSERKGLGDWTEPEKWGRDGEIHWEMKVRQGKAWMTSYDGNHYDSGFGAIDAFFQFSVDGLNWQPVDAAHPVVYKGGISEIGWEFAADGTLWAVLRNEDGDATGFGTQICSAKPGALGQWDCLDDSLDERYDSPRMFRHGKDLYLVARRDLNGKFDEHLDDLPIEDRKRRYLVDYWNRPKRTTLYRLDTEQRKPIPVLDFPSAGDTAFPGIVRTGPHTVLIANYTSPIDDPDLSWVNGQTSPKGTQIYLTTLTFTPKK